MSESQPQPKPAGEQPSAPAAAGPAPAGPAPISEETLKRALGAFKKRHKLTVLDQESHLGGMRPMTGGKRVTGPVGIRPPNDFPPPVWQALAAKGMIKDMGGGFYTMP